MFFSKEVRDENRISQKEYFLTQGDSATIESTPKHNGQLIDFSLIRKCVFKLADSNNINFFDKEFEKKENCFSITLTSDETSLFEVTKDSKNHIGSFIYEVEYTFIDNTVSTPNRYFFNILEQNINK